MAQSNVTDEHETIDELSDLGDEVMHQTGILDTAADHLSESTDNIEVDPDEVGHWITAIGKALLAIFKP